MSLAPIVIPKEALPFLQRIFGPLAEVGDLISDKIRFYRWKSSMETMARAEKIAKDRGLKVCEVPLKILVPLLEKASLESEDSPLIEKWAELLASAANNPDAIKLAYIDVLAKLDPTDASLLDSIVSPEIIAEFLEKKKESDLEFFVRLAPFLSATNSALQMHCIEIADESKECDGSNFDEVSAYFHEKFGVLENFEASISRFERVVITFDRDTEKKGIYYQNSKLDILTLDALNLSGLIVRKEFFYQSTSYRMQLSSIQPTALGVAFVLACRGEAV